MHVKFAETFGCNEAAELDRTGARGRLGLTVNFLRAGPVRSGQQEFVFLRDLGRKKLPGANEVRMVFAWRFDAGDVEDDLFRSVVAVPRKTALVDTVVVQHDLSPRDLPALHQVVRRALADGGYHIRDAPDAVWQDMADIEHSKNVVFRRDVVLGKVVYDGVSLARFSQQHAPVGRRNDKTVPPSLRKTPREQEKTVEHAEQRPSGPVGKNDMFEPGEFRRGIGGCFQDQR